MVLKAEDILEEFNIKSKNLNDKKLRALFDYYKLHCPSDYWIAMVRYVKKMRWLYYVLLPFKPIARTDLLAIYRLFEHLK